MTRRPGAIWHSGLKPSPDDEGAYSRLLRAPLAPVVWLTRNPEIAPGHSSFRQLRLTVTIPSTDRRLKNWEDYVRRHACDYDYYLATPRPSREADHWFVYFGTIPPHRITGLDFIERGGEAE
jgi:hypothetical protein